MRLLLLLIFSALLLGCTANTKSVAPMFSATNRIVEKTVTIPPPSLSIAYHLTSTNNPALIKAYQEYQRTGVAKTIETDQFVQFAYNAGSQPVIAASVFELTVISLENGEQVNSVSSGDPLRWSYALAYSGSGDHRQAHVMIKPAKSSISTDFFITTDRRAYLLKLVATANGKYVRDVRFWYPEVITNNWQQYNHERLASTDIIAELPNIDVSQLNFNYKLTCNGAMPVWMPQRVFDDGVHTYIQLPENSAATDLPVLFIRNGDTQEMVNYRVKMPYFVVDKVFSQAILLSGLDRHQQRVTITHAGQKGKS